jgi:hypothetical protein
LLKADVATLQEQLQQATAALTASEEARAAADAQAKAAVAAHEQGLAVALAEAHTAAAKELEDVKGQLAAREKAMHVSGGMGGVLWLEHLALPSNLCLQSL